jgi:hypothetical protein
MLNFIRHLARQTSTAASASLAAITLTCCLSATGCGDSAPPQAVAQNDAPASATDSTSMGMSSPMESPAGGSTEASMSMPGGPGLGHGADDTGSADDPATMTGTETALMEAEYASASTDVGTDPSSPGHGAESDPTLLGSAIPGGGVPGAESAFDPATAYTTGTPGGPELGSASPAAGSPTPSGALPGPAGSPGYGSAMQTPPVSTGDPAAVGAPSGEPETGLSSPETYAGGEGGIGGQGGGGGGQAPPADSPEFPAFQLVMGLMQGKYEELNKYVSGRARGELQKIGAGKLTDGEKAELKQTFAQPQLAGQPRNARGGRQIVLKSGENTITILVKKEGTDWKVSELSIRSSARR